MYACVGYFLSAFVLHVYVLQPWKFFVVGLDLISLLYFNLPVTFGGVCS